MTIFHVIKYPVDAIPSPADPWSRTGLSAFYSGLDEIYKDIPELYKKWVDKITFRRSPLEEIERLRKMLLEYEEPL